MFARSGKGCSFLRLRPLFRSKTQQLEALLLLACDQKRITVNFINTMSSQKDGVKLQEVVEQLGKFAATRLAESWDNVGLLVEPSGCHYVKKILLTNDLTQAVMKETISKSADMIVSYHPPIFKPLKRLCQGNWKERILTLSLENRIAIYSPHTCFDAVHGGVNDWLLSCFRGVSRPLSQSFDSFTTSEKLNGCYKLCFEYTDVSGDFETLRKELEASKEVLKSEYSKSETSVKLEVYTFPSERSLAAVFGLAQESSQKFSKSEVLKLEKLPLLGYGMGRILHLNESMTIEDVVSKVKTHLELAHLRLALARKASLQKKISTIAVCAGSGGSLLNGVSADVYISGEMSHHEVLHACESGRSVILCEHSNTERGFLKTLVPTMSGWFDGKVTVEVSQEDRDPLVTV